MVMHSSMWPPHSAPYLRSINRILTHRIHPVSVVANGTRQASNLAPAHDTDKRKAAMHVAYVGSNYLGLQIQNGPTPQKAIENVVHDAIFDAGMMLSTNKNDVQRLKWSRSSRTDKGVHSLGTVRLTDIAPHIFVVLLTVYTMCGCQVITCMLEVEKHAFDFDPRGVSIATCINSHLPKDVRCC